MISKLTGSSVPRSKSALPVVTKSVYSPPPLVPAGEESSFGGGAGGDAGSVAVAAAAFGGLFACGELGALSKPFRSASFCRSAATLSCAALVFSASACASRPSKMTFETGKVAALASPPPLIHDAQLISHFFSEKMFSTSTLSRYQSEPIPAASCHTRSSETSPTSVPTTRLKTSLRLRSKSSLPLSMSMTPLLPSLPTSSTLTSASVPAKYLSPV
mmetsp:Transcript_19900/g.64770  ORF Transcript_19900/g.64770 Transcript_19900/m.64770 type:complete len:216 (-) Transcript_19900:1963-2610(-)